MVKKEHVINALFAFTTSLLCAQSIEKDTVNALKEVVVSDTKFAQNKEKSGKVITKITAADLEKKAGQSLPMILNSLAGVEINGSQSANGKNLGYYIRGGKNQQVLILIDGTPVTDASGISIEFDLRLIAVDQIESIEIMKGASSTLYGTGAATAVINITLKKSSKKSIRGVVNMSVGSHTTASQSNLKGHDFNQSVALDGSAGAYDYLVSLSSVETTGMSQIASLAHQNNEWDRFSKINLRGKFGIKFSKKWSTHFFGTLDQIKNDYDAPFDNTGVNDTPLNSTHTEQTKFGTVSTFNYRKGTSVFNASFSSTKRAYSEFNSWTNTIEDSHYASRNVHLDFVNKYSILSDVQLISGLNYQFFDMNSATPYGGVNQETTKFNLVDVYVTSVWNAPFGFNLNIGTRLNHHSAYGLKSIFNINPSYNFGTENQHKVLASLSTAIVTPSLYQLYSEYGNNALMPEYNKTVEVGYETSGLKNTFHFNVVSFIRFQKNSFGFATDPVTFASNYVNVDGTYTAKGFEVESKYELNSKLNVHSNYTFTQVDDALNKLIPKHKINTALTYVFNKKVNSTLTYQYNSEKRDVYFDGNSYSNNEVQLKSYQLVHVSSSFDCIPNRLSLFLFVNNVFNVDFTENFGYATQGRNVKMGLLFKF